eukprot:scaffold87493_cov25-Tisochrysis_lutea.AAC.3
MEQPCVLRRQLGKWKSNLQPYGVCARGSHAKCAAHHQTPHTPMEVMQAGVHARRAVNGSTEAQAWSQPGGNFPQCCTHATYPSDSSIRNRQMSERSGDARTTWHPSRLRRRFNLRPATNAIRPTSTVSCVPQPLRSEFQTQNWPHQ